MPKKRQRVFRPAVAAIVSDRRGLILVCERTDTSGAWQFPQGGIDPGESPREALKREVFEEIGLKPQRYRIGKVVGPFRYRLPEGVRKQWYLGQSHHYYILHLTGNRPRLNFGEDDPEFQDARWIKPADFRLKWLPQNKRGAYRRALVALFGTRLNKDILPLTSRRVTGKNRAARQKPC